MKKIYKIYINYSVNLRKEKKYNKNINFNNNK